MRHRAQSPFQNIDTGSVPDCRSETVGARSEAYGPLRILRCLNSDTECDPQETIELVQRDLERFRGKAEQQDDITMMSFYVN